MPSLIRVHPRNHCQETAIIINNSTAQSLQELNYPNNGVGKFNQTPAVGKAKRFMYIIFESNVHNTKILNSKKEKKCKCIFQYLVMSCSSSVSTA